MKCSHAKKMISRYVDQDLSPDEKAALKLHADECPLCREELEQHMIIHNLFASAERFEAPLGFANAVMARIEEKEGRASFWAFFTLQPFFLRAVEVAFALVIVVVGMISGNVIVANRIPERPVTLRESFSLDVFEPAPPDSIGGAYTALSEENR